MTALTLFDVPLARNTDPQTSHLAAQSVRASRKELVGFIRQALERFGPLSHDHIALKVGDAQPGRWHSTTIVTACASACLHVWDYELNARGRQVAVWSLEPRPERPPVVELVSVKGDVL